MGMKTVPINFIKKRKKKKRLHNLMKDGKRLEPQHKSHEIMCSLNVTILVDLTLELALRTPKFV